MWTSCDIALFHRFYKPPYGGSNQFFMALRKEFTKRAFRVGTNCIGRNTRAAFINSFAFDADLLRILQKENCRVIHRVVGPVSIYRGDLDDLTDNQQHALNQEFSDVTVFQSRYSLEAHARLGFDYKNPEVIMNSVDPDIFFPDGSDLTGAKVRLIATSWSDHPNKGFATYKWMDENLDWSRFHFSFVGRTRETFRNIQVIPPVPSETLANLLRKHDIYITGSLHDTCSNGLLEGLACGLPAVFAKSGGNAEIVGSAGYGFESNEEIPDILDQLVANYVQCQANISIPHIDDVVNAYLSLIGLSDQVNSQAGDAS